jgi:signal peptide peptidase SppA
MLANRFLEEKIMYDSDSDEKTKPLAKISNWVAKQIGKSGAIIPVVRLHGVIAPEEKPNRLNIASVAPLLKKAFKIKKAGAVAIIVNSPGGYPVQSRLISKMIRDLAVEHKKKVLVFIEDVAASGGYFIAVAGDEVFADPSSIVGSIGVISSSFGFEDAIEKIGVKRRIHTAGKNKSTLDPFVKEKEEDVERLKGFQLDIHQVFIDHVKDYRGDKLNGKDDELFTGEWWTGVRALDLGLIDELNDMHSVLKERFGKDVNLKLIASKKGLFQLPNFGLSAKIDGAMIADGALNAIEERSLWSRFGYNLCNYFWCNLLWYS